MPTNPYEPPKEVGRRRPWPARSVAEIVVFAVSLLFVVGLVALAVLGVR